MFTIRVLVPCPDGSPDMRWLKEQILHADDVRLGPGWATLVSQGPGKAVTRITIPTDLVLEIVETVSAEELRAARRRLRRQRKEMGETIPKKRAQDPAYR